MRMAFRMGLSGFSVLRSDRREWRDADMIKNERRHGTTIDETTDTRTRATAISMSEYGPLCIHQWRDTSRLGGAWVGALVDAGRLTFAWRLREHD
jgi:hypothetical protein